MKGRGNPGRCSESAGRVSAENWAKRGLPFSRDLRYSRRRGLRRSRMVENNGELRTPPWTMHGHVRQRMHTRCTSNPLAGRGSTCVAIRATSATGCGTGAGRRTVSQLDARQVSPVWSIAAPSPVTVVRDETCVQRKRAMVAELFSLWRLAGRKSLFEDGGGLRLVARSVPQDGATATGKSSRRWRSVRLPNPRRPQMIARPGAR